MLIGKNGTGKSTVLKMLIGLEKINSGKIYIEEEEISYKKEELYKIRNKTGVLFQNLNEQIIGETILENLIFQMENNRIPAENMKANIRKYASFFKIESILKKKSDLLTAEEKCKGGIAGIISAESDIIIMDETTATLDEAGKREIRALLRRLIEAGKTVISVTHDMEEIKGSDYIVYLMGEGKVMEGPVNTLISFYEIEKRKKEEEFYKKMEEISKKLCDSDKREKNVKIKLKNLNLSFGENKIIDSLSASIFKGEITAVKGKSGSGKTLLLEMMAGIHPFSEGFSGEIEYTGKEKPVLINKDTPGKKAEKVLKNCSIMFQNPEDQFFENSVKDEIKYNFLKKYGLNDMEAPLLDPEVERIASLFNFTDEFLKKSPFVLSAGEKKIVSLAMLLCFSPEVIFLDEPFAGLDYDVKLEVIKILENLKNSGITIIFTGNEETLIEKYADSVIFLEKKEEIKKGKAELYENKNFKRHYFQKLDPRSKIFGAGILSILLLSSPFIQTESLFKKYFPIFLFIFIMLVFSRLNLRKLIDRVKNYMITPLILTVFNICFLKSGKLLFDFKFIKIYDSSITYSASIICQIFLLILVMEMFTETTKAAEIMKGINYITGRKGKNSEIALMFTVSISFLPVVYEQFKKIIKIQKSRGAKFSIKSVREIGEFFLIIIPLFHLILEKAARMAEVMEVKNYVVNGKITEYTSLKFRRRDFVYMGGIAFFSIIYIFFVQKI